MKKSKTLFVALLLAMLCMLLPLNAMAATTTQYGLEVELTTDRQSYNAGDTVQATLKVKNSSGIDFDDVTLENLLPEGCVLSTDSETSLTADIKAGETVVLETSYIVEGAIVLPGTGDNSTFTAWCILFIAASVAIIVFKKKGAHGMLALLLCVAMVSSVFAAPIAVAAGEQVVIEICEKASCAGKNVEFSAEVRYALPDGAYDEEEISFANIDPEHVVHDESRDIYYVDNQILLTAKEDVPRTLVEQLITSLGGRTVGVIAITGDYQVEFDQPMTYNQLQQLVAKFNLSELIYNADLHVLIPTEYNMIPNDGKWKNEEWSAAYPEGINWGVEAIDAMGAWDHRVGMNRVSVGIIDSMFDTSHRDLNFYRVWNNADFEMDWFDQEYPTKAHGTHVAGTFTAMFNNENGIAGVAPELLRYGYSILGSTEDSVLLDSNKSLVGRMEWKYALALLITSDCRVINVSMEAYAGKDNNGNKIRWPQSYYDDIDQFLTRLKNQGFDFLIVQAAGNDNVDATNSGLFVGCKENRDRILVVGSVGNNGSHKDGLFGVLGNRIFDGYTFSSFSNWGSRVDIVAPGEKIYSTVPDNKYEDNFWFTIEGKVDIYNKYWDGTSMAAPHAAGVAALCFSVNPNLTAEQVKEIIIKSASDTGSTFVNRTGDSRNYPLLDASDAVDLALTYTTTTVEMPDKGTVMGVVYRDGSREMLSGVEISAHMTSPGNEDSEFISSTTTNEYDAGYIMALEPGTYSLSFHKEGYLPHIITGVKVFNNQVTYLDDVFMIEGEEAKAGTVTGRITDAVTGTALSDVQITFYPGWNNTMIIPEIWHGRLVTCTTDSDGRYTAEIQEGAFTAVMTKEGYAQGSMNVTSRVSETNTHNGALSPLQAAEQYRVVLTWGATPEDLDSHLTGALDNGNTMHIYYSDMNATLNSEKLADLDVDDVDSYGPETVTLYLPDSGSFRYSVHDYTNRNETSSRVMGQSGAKVTVYKGSRVVASYPVPNQEGTVWNVFDLENGVIRPVNTMSYTVDPEDVGSLVSTYRMRRATTYHEDDKDYN